MDLALAKTVKSIMSEESRTLSASKRRLLELRLKEKLSSALLPTIPRRPVRETAELSFAQERLWFLDQLEPKNAAYNIPLGLRLNGHLDLTAFQASLHEIIRRHEALRTYFEVIKTVPCQIIDPAARLELPLHDLSRLPEAQREAEVRRLVDEEARQPFDLTHSPLLRANLYRLGPEKHIFLLVMHHIAADGWSIGVLLHEIKVLYQAFCEGKSPPLPELPIQYADYAEWQRGESQRGLMEQQVAYWRKQLTGAPTLLELPTDRPRPAEQSYRGAVLNHELPNLLLAGLKELSQHEGASLFMTLLAAFQTLLYRYTGQDDVVVGTAFAGRNRTELENLIGFFVNTLVMRGDLSGNPTFRELLGRTREVALGAYAHQDLPFEKLVEILQPDRDASRPPLFQVMLVLHNTPVEAVHLSGLECTPMAIDIAMSKFDLTLYVREDGSALKTTVEYSTDLFDEKTVRRMMGHYQKLLEGIVTNPDQHLADLSMLAESERRQIVDEWNRTEVDYPQDRCLHQLIEDQVERAPEAVAIAFKDQQLTYRQLNERANQLAHHLQKSGVGPDTLVGICVERSLEMVVGLLAILKAGGAYVPMDPEYPQERLAFMLEDANVPVLLTQAHLLPLLPPHQAKTIQLDADWPTIAAESTTSVPTDVAARHLAYMIYTSGSTGRPKGAMNTHVGIVNRLLWMQDAYRLTPADRVLQKTPFSFDVSVWEFFWPLLTGARLVMALPGGHRDGNYLKTLIMQEQITTLHFVPSMLSAFLEQDGLPQACASLRRVICSGEALSYELQQRCFSVLPAELHNLYGPTEAAVDVTYWACQRKGTLRTVPIGRPIANTQIYILDQNLQPVPVGVPGELHIGGLGLARGYHRRPELTAEKFIANPFSDDPQSRLYKTGDLSRYLADGTIEYLGRLDHQVKIRGFRVELGEIEMQLNQHPTIREAVVLAREDTPGDKRLVAYVTPKDALQPKAAELREALKAKLPEYMLPAAFIILERFPLTPNGKIDRRALPKPEFASAPRSYIPPSTDTEIALAKIWAEILGLKQVSIADSFFEIGGHSLLAIRLASEIQRQFQFNLPVRVLFQHPTIHGLAAELSRPRPKERKPEFIQLRRISSGPQLVFLIDEGSLGLFKLSHLMSQDMALYASVVPLPEAALKASAEKRLAALPTMEELAAWHVAQIRSHQLPSPLVLAGHCFGGRLAFEVAHQLQDSGQAVEAVLMLDTWMTRPPLWWRLKTWIQAHSHKLWRQGLGYLWHKSRRRVRLERQELASQLKFKANGDFSMHVPWTIIERIYRQANLGYRPQVLSSRGILLVSQDDWQSNAYRRLDDSLGTRRWFTEGVEVINVPGDHVTVLDEAHLDELARCFEHSLELLKGPPPSRTSARLPK
jgi:amino acid adenylation domain-containing protein